MSFTYCLGGKTLHVHRDDEASVNITPFLITGSPRHMYAYEGAMGHSDVIEKSGEEGLEIDPESIIVGGWYYRRVDGLLLEGSSRDYPTKTDDPNNVAEGFRQHLAEFYKFDIDKITISMDMPKAANHL